MRIQLAFVSLIVFGAWAAARHPLRLTAEVRTGRWIYPARTATRRWDGKPIRSKPEFDHNRTKFPLRGMHESVTCNECHTKPVFSNTATRCADCHADIHKRQFDAKCGQRHTFKGWNVQITQIKDHMNRFPLLGAHERWNATHAIIRGRRPIGGSGDECYSCHAADFKGTTNPNHVAGGFSTTCEQCNGFDNWLNAKFDRLSTAFH